MTIVGHTGQTDDPDVAFRYRDELCQPFTKRRKDPVAPYDGYMEMDDAKRGCVAIITQRRKRAREQDPPFSRT